MLSFQEFQSTIKENIPYYLWEFEQTANNDEYWAKIKTTITTDLRFVHDAVVNCIQLGF